MRDSVAHNPPLSLRELEEQRLREEAKERFAPAKPGVFAERRAKLVEKYVREGLKKFDAQQDHDDGDELIFPIEL